MARETVYSDESGNTGPDLTNVDQPIFVTSFVFISDEQIAEATTTIQEIFAAAQAAEKDLLLPELKFEKLASSGRGRRLLATLMQKLSASLSPLGSASSRSASKSAR